jgi:predicted small metal-binding protein
MKCICMSKGKIMIDFLLELHGSIMRFINRDILNWRGGYLSGQYCRVLIKKDRKMLRGRIIMRLFECCSLVPDCQWQVRSNESAEIVHRAVAHMRNAHGDTVQRENLVYKIKVRITEVREGCVA